MFAGSRCQQPCEQMESVVLSGGSRNRLNGVTYSIHTGVTAILGHSGATTGMHTGGLQLQLSDMEPPDSIAAVERTFPSPPERSRFHLINPGNKNSFVRTVRIIDPAIVFHTLIPVDRTLVCFTDNTATATAQRQP